MRRTVINVRAAAVLVPVGVIVSLLWPQMASATTQMTATVGVNIRSGSSTNTDILGGLFRGQTVTAISSSQGWTKISYDGATAYVASRYLTKGKDLPPPLRIGAGTVKVTTTALNLRSGPGLSYSVIKVLKGGARVTMTGKTARGWAQLVNGRSTGWSSMQYLVSSMYGRPTIIGKRVATADLDIRTTSGTALASRDICLGQHAVGLHTVDIPGRIERCCSGHARGLAREAHRRHDIEYKVALALCHDVIVRVIGQRGLCFDSRVDVPALGKRRAAAPKG